MEPVTKEDYYKDNTACSFSGLKVFSKCETLYRDIFVTKEYEEPDYDYFVYGKLVDAMTTEPESFIEENFIKVERKVRAEDALKIENDITMLKLEIDEKKAEGNRKNEAKRAAIKEKIDAATAKIAEKRAAKPDADVTKDLDKVAKLNTEMTDLPMDKTIEKGIASREAQITELQSKLDAIKMLGTKQQVTPSVWQNALETAAAIKSHPSFQTMEFNEATSQQVFRAEINGIPCKGKLDHLKLSPTLTTLYAVYVAGQMTLEELRAKIASDVHETDKWAIITDIKTCRDLKSLEPYNNHYRGQLGFYRVLVSTVLGIPKENIRGRILVADKMNNDFKKVELFEYTASALEELQDNIWQWAALWHTAMKNNLFISDKAKRGMQQECFTCSECRFCPFALVPGTPVLVNSPRFGSEKVELELVDTADAVLNY